MRIRFPNVTPVETLCQKCIGYSTLRWNGGLAAHPRYTDHVKQAKVLLCMSTLAFFTEVQMTVVEFFHTFTEALM